MTLYTLSNMLIFVPSRYQIYATMASFYVPLCVMIVVYVKILRVVADKKKQMGWKPGPTTPSHKSVHRNTSASIATNYTSTASLRGSTGVTTSLVSTCPTGANSLLTPSSTPSHHPQHPLVTRALVTNSVGGSPVTITTIVSGSSATSSPIRRGSLSRGSPGGGVEDGSAASLGVSGTNTTNNNKKDSTASQNAAVTTPLLMKANGGAVRPGSPSRNYKYNNTNNNKKTRRSRHQERVDSRNSINLQQHSQQNGNVVTHFFSGNAIHRIKKGKREQGWFIQNVTATACASQGLDNLRRLFFHRETVWRTEGAQSFYHVGYYYERVCDLLVALFCIGSD